MGYCPKCGKEVKVDDKFCLNCGASLQNAPVQQATPPPTQQAPPAVAPSPQPANTPPAQQTYAQSQAYVPTKKSNAKTIGIIVGVIAVVIVIALVMWLFVFSGDNAKFVGNWELESMSIDGQSSEITGQTITFKSDGTYQSFSSGTEADAGNWELRNNKLYMISSNSEWQNPYYEQGVNYQFSNGDRRLTITFSGSDGYTSSTSSTYVYVLNKL